jgi:hypothetical protein
MSHDVTTNQSFFRKGSAQVDKHNNYFPEDESSGSEGMIGGLGSKISKDHVFESSVFSHPSSGSNKMFDSFEDRTGSVTRIEKEE